MTTASHTDSASHITQVEQFSAHNYKPLPIVVAHAEGVWVTDVEGRRYMDMLAAYSAVNFGHTHPELVAAAKAQLDRVTLTSRAFYNDQLGPFCAGLADLCCMEAILPMNTGAEGVETALKTARKWGHVVKGVAENQGKILCCTGNFHGRTTTIISFSDDEQSRFGFGPFTPGFELVPYGDLEALRKALTPETVAFLVEPIQGEAGIIVPPPGYLKAACELCRAHNVLFIADEIQSGLGRTGKTFACEHENVHPDIYIFGKALGGGIMPISAIATTRAIISVFKPGDHGSTFGGNPLACAVATKVLEILNRRTYQENAAKLGAYLFERLAHLKTDKIREVRGRGLWAGIELKESAGKARPYCEKLMAEGLLCKDTHAQTIRLAPPLCITPEELDWALERIEAVLR
ncbi:MAG: ornithine--oxo-acid transaminase [Phycisphaerales bacterium]|nr:ornithine--oxo-acid transaminase [Phycisphaerales bacterium]